jgi:transcriptional regulator with XRE-family HTH domain
MSHSAWAEWWRVLARQHRELREFLGLSQLELAEMAGVSQGAISRLEAGRGLATPLLVIVKIGLVFRHALERIDPAVLSPNLHRFLELEKRLSPPIGDTGFSLLPLTWEPDLQTLVRLYHALPERQRRPFFSIASAVAGALGAQASKGNEGEK